MQGVKVDLYNSILTIDFRYKNIKVLIEPPNETENQPSEYGFRVFTLPQARPKKGPGLPPT